MNILDKIATEWATRSFGADHVSNQAIRALRLCEEAVELAQSVGVPLDKLHLLIDTVYGRPVGDPRQELGGVEMTAAVMAASLGIDRHEAFQTELLRVLAKTPEHFANRNRVKIEAGLTA